VGSGLGLPIAVAMAEAQDGKLDLESTLGAGTTAHVRFSNFISKLA
jgi:signal transduction histidine kinase